MKFVIGMLISVGVVYKTLIAFCSTLHLLVISSKSVFQCLTDHQTRDEQSHQSAIILKPHTLLVQQSSC